MLRILGYPDRYSVPQGGEIKFMVSLEQGDTFTARLVRVVNGDCNPEGPGLDFREIAHPANRTYPGKRQAIDAVRLAQTESMALMKPGVPADEVDRRARESLAGDANAFQHGLGHGIGLAVHERPFLSPSDQTPLQAGMVITNEPGIYRPGWGGVRLEEMVLVTDKGPEVLTPASREVSLG